MGGGTFLLGKTAESNDSPVPGAFRRSSWFWFETKPIHVFLLRSIYSRMESSNMSMARYCRSNIGKNGVDFETQPYCGSNIGQDQARIETQLSETNVHIRHDTRFSCYPTVGGANNAQCIVLIATSLLPTAETFLCRQIRQPVWASTFADRAPQQSQDTLSNDHRLCRRS